jgi:hypothetical protein
MGIGTGILGWKSSSIKIQKTSRLSKDPETVNIESVPINT